MRVLVCLSLILVVSCSSRPSPSSPPISSITSAPSPAPVSVHSEEVSVGLQYWAIPTPILCKDWRLVVGGTVLETHEEEGIKDVHPAPFINGTLTVERIFLNLQARDEVVFPSLKRFKADVFDGLRRGDKVIVFVNEYDGGYGIIEAPDSNCDIGIKVAGWDEPIVGAIEEMIRGGGADNTVARWEMLKDRRHAKVWRPYSSKGIAYLLKGKGRC